MDEWEEPHPGRRSSFLSKTTTISPCAADHACAAREAPIEPKEAPNKPTSRPGGAKSLLLKSQLLSRLWLRPKPAIPTCSCCCPLSTSILDTSQGLDTDAVPAMCHAHSVDCLPMGTTHIGLAADTAAEIDDSSISPSCAMETTASSECERVTISDIGEDPYGWDAELSRRQSCSIVRVRQGKDGKRKSLRRRLNLGSGDAPTNPR